MKYMRRNKAEGMGGIIFGLEVSLKELSSAYTLAVLPVIGCYDFQTGFHRPQPHRPGPKKIFSA
jgi:hypothetical protein